MANTFACPMCMNNVLIFHASTHLARCLYVTAKENNSPIICTCPNCQGLQTHPLNPPAALPFTPTANEGIRLHTPSAIAPDRPPRVEQLTELVCFVCGQQKEKVIAGSIRIGKWRTIKFCKKGEMREETTRTFAEKWIDYELKNVIETNDVRPDGRHDCSEDEDENVASQTRAVKCSGFKDDTANKPCNAVDFPPHLHYVTPDQSTHYFCKSCHLIRYLVKFYTAVKRGPNKKRKTAAPPPSVIDVEEEHNSTDEEIIEDNRHRLRKNKTAPSGSSASAPQRRATDVAITSLVSLASAASATPSPPPPAPPLPPPLLPSPSSLQPSSSQPSPSSAPPLLPALAKKSARPRRKTK